MSGQLTGVTLRNCVLVGTLTLPNSVFKNAHVAGGAAIDANKLVNRHAINYHQADGSAVATASVPIHVARGTSAELVAIEVAVVTAASGDSEVAIDLQKGNSGSAFASVLTSAITIDASVAARDRQTGAISSISVSDGDVLLLDITATAGTGTLPQGLIVTVTIDETP